MTHPRDGGAPKIVIVGMGPCGLGAAWRLQELQHDNFIVFESRSFPGGLATSYIDDEGFTWDIGGHVQFSHYSYFDRLMDSLLGDGWLYHERSSWVWIHGRFVPYPFQNNIRYLPREHMWECLAGIIDVYENPPAKPANFQEWILATFGKGIAAHFLIPYNFKVWAYPPEMLAYHWVGDRVAVTDLKRVTQNVLFGRDDVSWGPNNTFRFPKTGGTGEIWRRLADRIDSQKMRFNSTVRHLDTRRRVIECVDGTSESYDVLITTMPLDRLICLSDLEDKSAVEHLAHSSVHVFGIGLRGQPPPTLRDKCWMYFPEPDCPFYRVTVFSNYSPGNVPDPAEYWSLMAEVSESAHKLVDRATVVESVVQGLLNTRLIASRDEIVNLWYHYEPYGYPTPILERDTALPVLRRLEERQVYSRGRFGAWKYEVSNQDHTCMQGVELVNRLLLGEPELTIWAPEAANAPGKR